MPASNQFFSYYKYSPPPPWGWEISANQVYIIIIIPQPITYSGDQVVTPTALNTKNQWLNTSYNFQVQRDGYQAMTDPG